MIRRHPDIKWLRRAEDIPELATRQLALLNSLWRSLKPGGRLLYAVCSVFSAEGDEVIERFLAAEPSASTPGIDAQWGEATRFGRRIATGEHNMDGFYYALLLRSGG